MIFITNAAGHCIYTSAEWTNWTGQAGVDALGKGWLSKVHQDDQSTVEKIFCKATQHAAEFSIRYRLLKANGAPQWVGAGGVPSFGIYGNAFIGYVGTITALAEGATDTIAAYGNVEQVRPLGPHPAMTPVDALDRIADHLIIAHSLIEAEGCKAALPDVRKALFRVGQALASRITDQARLN
ncbi:PAS domain-containing protein [Methylobacterium sp. WL116]|uniref:PAS domain-containing protein n=1 Tax=Methylobacterium sp. WL116 TaxID=2603889 RepID=UPI0011CA8204|nr:PAS domain-containing protein [Methylobacterium sp. WL116]TXM93824.1 PAS domain-containing protein [Methylobacterium sp. WL116]